MRENHTFELGSATGGTFRDGSETAHNVRANMLRTCVGIWTVLSWMFQCLNSDEKGVSSHITTTLDARDLRFLQKDLRSWAPCLALTPLKRIQRGHLNTKQFPPTVLPKPQDGLLSNHSFRCVPGLEKSVWVPLAVLSATSWVVKTDRAPFAQFCRLGVWNQHLSYGWLPARGSGGILPWALRLLVTAGSL